MSRRIRNFEYVGYVFCLHLNKIEIELFAYSTSVIILLLSKRCCLLSLFMFSKKAGTLG